MPGGIHRTPRTDTTRDSNGMTPMARYAANPAPFNHVTDTAPEYVDVILWHRVALVTIALVLILAGTGYGAYTLIGKDDGKTDSALAVNAITRQAPPGAVADSDGPATSPVTQPLAQQNTPAEKPIENAAPAADRTARQIAAPHADPTNTAAPIRTHPDRQVHTAILMPAVRRAVLTDSIQGREPGATVTDTASLGNREDFTLHFFIDIHGRAGDTLTWKWKHDGKPITTTRIRVGTDTWRGHASKHFNPASTGDWQIDVTDQRDILLVRSEFHLGQ